MEHISRDLSPRPELSVSHLLALTILTSTDDELHSARIRTTATGPPTACK